uniref:Ankyrin repeat domain-containing protein 49 n=1 Tax=Geotrypetes seraphini TaxID=260995 RepID=A0A6P8RA68_GEOSA|nr:ankyrin repeat domain-containing protein 49 [Geotrypetes seraphini]XP_033805571.1 ankyrin repeat domain-containing protein 49 [Geotrypetes seraphini]XP_033805572.1 ankyrin repeat domain-containing protein 49 [Geotrypetes seraphini]XP_033805573.1 ankyrin repeat domain-containing protein 49 [Geotrypetes seraphini]
MPAMNAADEEKHSKGKKDSFHPIPTNEKEMNRNEETKSNREKRTDHGNESSEETLKFSEDFNQLELLETHRQFIPTGTHSLWPGESDKEDEEEEEEGGGNEEWYQMQEQKMENDTGKLLLWASEKNRLITMKRLLTENPALAKVKDEDLYTPLHRAAYNGHLEAAQVLIAHGADVAAVTVDGWTPLHSACKWNNTTVASFLLQHGADINAQTNGLLTPLHLAAGNRESRDTLELLLMNRYIKPNLKNNLDETAYDIARRSDMHYYLFEIAESCTNSAES